MSRESEIRDAVKAELDDFLENIEKKFDYRESYLEEQAENSRLRETNSKLQEQLRAAQPGEYQLQQWEEAKTALKKVTELKKNAYNEGYAAAYVDVTNRMKSATPTSQY